MGKIAEPSMHATKYGKIFAKPIKAFTNSVRYGTTWRPERVSRIRSFRSEIDPFTVYFFSNDRTAEPLAQQSRNPAEREDRENREFTQMDTNGERSPTDSSRLRYTAPSQGKPRIDSTCNPPGPPGKPGPGRPENIIRREVDRDQRKRGFHGWHG